MIDLRSDTVTRPSAGMLEAMFSAKVGDDVLGDDPTVKELERRTAAIFGKEAGLFFPSGTMANQVAIARHAGKGDEVLCDDTAHVYRSEGGGIAANSGASVRLLQGERGIFTSEQLENNLNSDDIHHASTRLVCIENTVNKGGGACWNLQQIQSISEICTKHNLALHMDGARLWNAMVATQTSGEKYGEYFDSISVCFSKGLGCPVGSVLLGNVDFILGANRVRKRMGGGMRQSGYLAKAALYALENNIHRLAEDHVNAKKVANNLSEYAWVKHILPVETNIVLFQINEEAKTNYLIDFWMENGVLATDNGKGWIRLVFHLDIHAEMIPIIIRLFDKTFI